jgi:hypothetical protein
MQMPASREVRSVSRRKAGRTVDESPYDLKIAECGRAYRQADWMIWSKLPKLTSTPKESFQLG